MLGLFIRPILSDSEQQYRGDSGAIAYGNSELNHHPALEIQLKPELKLAGGVCRAGNLCETCVTIILIRYRQNRGVRQVERLKPKFKLCALSNGKNFEQREVHIFKSIGSQAVPAQIAKGTRGRSLKCCVVDPACGCMYWTPVRASSGVGIAYEVKSFIITKTEIAASGVICYVSEITSCTK